MKSSKSKSVHKMKKKDLKIFLEQLNLRRVFTTSLPPQPPSANRAAVGGCADRAADGNRSTSTPIEAPAVARPRPQASGTGTVTRGGPASQTRQRGSLTALTEPRGRPSVKAEPRSRSAVQAKLCGTPSEGRAPSVVAPPSTGRAPSVVAPPSVG